MRRALASLIPLALALAACSSGDDTTATSDSTGASTEITGSNPTEGTTSDPSGSSVPSSSVPPLQPAAVPEGCEPREETPATTLPEPLPDPGTAPEFDLPASIPEELGVIELQAGEGREAQAGDTVLVYYKGVLSDSGVEFDSNYGSANPFPVTLGQGGVIQGWDQGLIGVQKGSVVQLDIPSDLAYGESGQGDVIGPNAALTFVVSIVDVVETPEQYVPLANDPADEPDLMPEPAVGEVPFSVEDLTEGDKCEYAQLGDQVWANVKTFDGTTLDVLESTWQPLPDGSPRYPYPVSLTEGTTVYGLAQGIIGMGVGGQRLVTVPPADGFGAEGNETAGLAADTNLILIVELVAIEGRTESPEPPPTTAPASLPLDTVPEISTDTSPDVSTDVSTDTSTGDTSTGATWPSIDN